MTGDEIAQIANAGVDKDFAIVTVVMIALVLIVVPAILLDYRMKSRRNQARAADEAGGATKGLWDMARRMEERIGYLETVLDTEVPGWRSRSGR